MVSDHLAHWEQQPKREETNGSEGLRERRHDASAHCRAGRRAAADFSAEPMKARKKKKGREMKENHAQPVIPHSVKIIYQN